MAIYIDCPLHGTQEKCQCECHKYYTDENSGCMECNGGLGDDLMRWCEKCNDEWQIASDD